MKYSSLSANRFDIFALRFQDLATKDVRMGRRIKIIHWITIMALLALIVLQGYWLFNQYVYTLQQYEDELFERTIEFGKIEQALRKELQNDRLKVLTRWQMNVTRNDTVTDKPEFEWIIDTWIIDKNIVDIENYSPEETTTSPQIKEGVVKYSFEIKDSKRELDIYEMIERFRINALCPFSVERFKLLIEAQNIEPSSVKKEITDSIIWKSQKVSYFSILNPTIEITYPFNPLQKEQVRVTYKLGISPILGKMFESLLCSIVLSLLLIFCLTYQIRTIFKQQRIDELRKSFINTMIHELKRPVATLKMCLSFMKHDKMMQDKAMKEDIIRTSQHELNNLSSYFSKLRDLTYGDMEEIPLNLSTFNIKELVMECIEKQNIPIDRQVHISTHFDEDNPKITADRMHIDNILCNLLENAIKYSDKEVAIQIKIGSVKDKYRIEISDNGFGIHAAECNYVFDKFYRSKAIAHESIPGIGLGLCYVKLLVTAHKGNISLESIYGAGSKFIIEIPKKQ